MKKKTSLHIVELICLISAVFFACYFLFQDGGMLPISINSFWLSVNNHVTRHFHLIAVALLPIYVALMVFGTAVFGMYFGSMLQRAIALWRKHK